MAAASLRTTLAFKLAMAMDQIYISIKMEPMMQKDMMDQPQAELLIKTK
ncbi:MAG: hypothetical protein N4A31_02405 [Rickettsiales bacterium]|jgi:hypothetical protein|nr:hypothetical protein [Rickettsiales bacterium]